MPFNAEKMQHPVLERMRDEWGWIALRGVCALIFGLLALVAGVRMRESGRPLWSLIVVGLLGIAAGIVTFFWPGLTALTLVLIIGSWAIAIGLLQIITAVRLRKQIEGEWLHALSGLLSIAFGLAVVLRPGAGAIALAWLIGWFAIFFGMMLLVLALRLRSQRAA